MRCVVVSFESFSFARYLCAPLDGLFVVANRERPVGERMRALSGPDGRACAGVIGGAKGRRAGASLLLLLLWVALQPEGSGQLADATALRQVSYFCSIAERERIDMYA
jgi:hypothetical protein